MLKNIFDVAPGTGTSPIIDTVGRFRSGHQLSKRPIALSEWRVTTDDPTIADKISELYGGERQSWDSEREPFETFTNVSTVNVIVEPDAIRSSMVLYGRAGAIRRCDGETIFYPKESAGTPCVCAGAATMQERKAAAQAGTGCQPEVIIRFRLADAPDLGVFKFVTGSWSMAKDIGPIENQLSALLVPQKATLTLEPVSFEKDGLKRQFTKPVLALLGDA